jgi:hypothetical protein
VDRFTLLLTVSLSAASGFTLRASFNGAHMVSTKQWLNASDAPFGSRGTCARRARDAEKCGGRTAIVTTRALIVSDRNLLDSRGQPMDKTEPDWASKRAAELLSCTCGAEGHPQYSCICRAASRPAVAAALREAEAIGKVCTRDRGCKASSHFGDCASMPSATPVNASALRKERAEGYEAGIEEACKALCSWCSNRFKRDDVPIQPAEIDGVWFHGPEQRGFICEAGKIRALTAKEPSK